MLEILIFVALIFVIAVLFYKQRRPTMEILQAEETQLDQLSDLLEEQQPLVVRGITPPKGLTQESLQRIPRLAQFNVGGQALEDILKTPDILFSANGAPVISQENRELLANELSIKVWADHNWLSRFSQSTWLGWAVGCMRTEVILGGMGMYRTTANTTCIMPTEGTYTISLLSRDSETFLPPSWKYRYPGSLSPNDTPMVADLRYMDIILRPGTMLCLPPHIVYSMEPKEKTFAAAALLEYHEPISLLSKSFS